LESQEVGKVRKWSNRLTFEFGCQSPGNQPHCANCKPSRQRQLAGPSLQLQHESSNVLLAGMEKAAGEDRFPEAFRMESTTRWLANPTPCRNSARIKTNSSSLITPKAGWSISAFSKQSSFGGRDRIEPATSSLRTVVEIAKARRHIT